MRIKQVDRKAVLSGDVVVYLKESQHYLNEEREVFDVMNIRAKKIAIVEIDGKCYVSMRFNKGTLRGLLFETRDSFDDLVAQYQGKEIAGGNASETKE